MGDQVSRAGRKFTQVPLANNWPELLPAKLEEGEEEQREEEEEEHTVPQRQFWENRVHSKKFLGKFQA